MKNGRIVKRMNNEHLSTEEIGYFLSCKKINTEYFMLSAKINKHICECSECRSMYDAMLNLDDTMEQMIFEKEIQESEIVEDEEQSSIISLLRKKFSEKKIKEIIDNLGSMKEQLKVGIESLARIEPIQAVTCFRHPVSPAFAKSSSSSQEASYFMNSVLVDNQYNKLVVGQDGSLRVVLEEQSCGRSDYAILVALDMSNIYISERKIDDGDKSLFTFYDICPGEYSIFI